MGKLKRIFYGLSVMLLFFACTKEKVLQEAPNDNELKVNESFMVILSEDHRTGYTWFLDKNFDEAIISHIATVWHGNNKGVYYSFKSNKPGTCSLKFVSRKYTDTADFKYFTLKVSPQ